ncbi:retinol dehydrogenase 13 isoform X2 [Carcharodon carcharias]|uniref:retinol dehydrogenase 13 isoform X2 n=1 Tax=Carcharodon carcharias TaxID=13397 RepID=UPI001B7E2337|nr:retinol dehydrogenase 13 isoform X2 [Carcharodon carcharias]
MVEFLQRCWLLASSLTAAGIGFILLRRWCSGGVCKSKARLDGKTVIITGANVGIGKETARALAQRGARVILACRDLDKARKASNEIRIASGNGNVVVQKLDLASLQSVRSFANKITETETHLDILINNAGKIHFDDINLDNSYNSGDGYNQSKLANILFTRELAKKLKGTGVTANCLHPGVIMTELGRHYIPTLAIWWKILLALIAFLIFKKPWQGAQTTIYCAVAEELDNVSGLYFSDCAAKETALQAQDDEAAKRLWELSEKMVGLDESKKQQLYIPES